MSLHKQLADLNRRLPAEAGMPPSKPGPLRPRETPPPPPPFSPHHHPAGACVPEPPLAQEAQSGVLPSPHSSGTRIIMVKITPFKEIVHPKINILASFTHPYVIPNLYDFFLILNTKEEF